MAAFGLNDFRNPVTYQLAADNRHASNLAPALDLTQADYAARYAHCAEASGSGVIAS